MKLFYLVLGGAAGTVSRYWLSGFINERTGPGFPFGTLGVNALGCLLVGILSALDPSSIRLSPETRFFLTVGFCGAFTTFSALILETDQLAANGQMFHAAGNIFLSVAAGLAAFFIGGWIGSRI